MTKYFTDDIERNDKNKVICLFFYFVIIYRYYSYNKSQNIWD